MNPFVFVFRFCLRVFSFVSRCVQNRYAEDFGTHSGKGYGVLRFIEQYANEGVRDILKGRRGAEVELIYNDYDWGLTDAALQIQLQPDQQ